MTIICAYYDAAEKQVWMAADSRTTADGLLVSDVSDKIVRIGPWLVGMASSAFAWDVLIDRKQKLAKFDQPTDLVGNFFTALREAGFTSDKSESGPSYWQTTLLLAHPEKGLFSIDGERGTTVLSSSYAATGSGRSHVEGAMHVLHSDGCTPEMLVTRGVEAAMRWNVDCGGSTSTETLSAADIGE